MGPSISAMESEEIDYERMQVGTSFGWAFSLASVFGFAAGYVDANTRKRFGTFGSLMTGNAVQLGTSIVGGNWLEAGLCMITLTAFGSGLLLAAHMIHLGVAGRESLVEFEVGSEKKAKDITQDLPTCMRLQAGFLISFALMSADVLFWALDPHGSIDPRFASAFAAFAMGLQNVFTLQGALHQNTSLLGGSLQQLAFICYRWLLGDAPSDELRNASEFTTVFIGYLCGAAAGSASLDIIGQQWSVWPAGLLIACGLWLTPNIIFRRL